MRWSRSGRGEPLRHADVARYTLEASEERVAVFQPEADPHRPERLSLMSDLREALVQDQLSLHFQPNCCLREARAARVDWFATDQLAEPTREHGRALTLALNWRPRRDWRFGIEWIGLVSERGDREELDAPERLVESQLQLSARWIFELR